MGRARCHGNLVLSGRDDTIPNIALGGISMCMALDIVLSEASLEPHEYVSAIDMARTNQLENELLQGC